MCSRATVFGDCGIFLSISQAHFKLGNMKIIVRSAIPQGIGCSKFALMSCHERVSLRLLTPPCPPRFTSSSPIMLRLRSSRCKTIESLNSYPAKAHHHAPKLMHNPRRITTSQQRMNFHTEKDPSLPENMEPIIPTGSFYKTQQTPVGDASRTKKTPRSAAYVQDDQSPTLAATTALRSRSVATRQGFVSAVRLGRDGSFVKTRPPNRPSNWLSSS